MCAQNYTYRVTNKITYKKIKMQYFWNSFFFQKQEQLYKFQKLGAVTCAVCNIVWEGGGVALPLQIFKSRRFKRLGGYLSFWIHKPSLLPPPLPLFSGGWEGYLKHILQKLVNRRKYTLHPPFLQEQTNGIFFWVEEFHN